MQKIIEYAIIDFDNSIVQNLKTEDNSVKKEWKLSDKLLNFSIEKDEKDFENKDSEFDI